MPLIYSLSVWDKEMEEGGGGGDEIKLYCKG